MPYIYDVRHLLSILAIALFVGLTACTPDEAPPGPTITQYYVKAEIDGVPFEASHAVIASVNDSVLNIRGSAGSGIPNLAISLDRPELGSNAIGGNTADQVIWTRSTENDPDVAYRAALGSGTGVVILSRFDEKVEGTFEAVAFNPSGDSVVITNGTFYAHLQP